MYETYKLCPQLYYSKVKRRDPAQSLELWGPLLEGVFFFYPRRFSFIRREEIAISTLMRAEIARRSCRCLQATYGRGASYMSVQSGPWRYH